MKKIIVVISLFYFTIGYAQNLDLAKDYYTHNLKQKAIEEFILVYHNSKSVEAKSEALYLLGNISFEDNNYSAAFSDWKKLVSDYPNSKYATEIKDRLDQLKDVIQKVSDENISSSVARSYLNNGDFWSESDNKFLIDNSWLPSVEMSISWYDKVIKEFPNTNASETAYRKKLFSLFGWKESGSYPKSFGLRKDFDKYMPQILQTYSEFEANFPESSSLQGFRYQIAQGYWREKDWTKAKEWLQKIIDSSKGQSTFYTETAKARLNKLEY